MIRLDRVQQGLFQVLGSEADVVAWSMGKQPRDDGESLLTLRLVSGPVTTGNPGGAKEPLCPADSIVVRVPAPIVGRRLVAELNGFDYRHDVGAGETAEDVRDSLLAAISPGEEGAVTATADGTDGIALAADFLGGLREVRLHGGLTFETPVFSGDAVEVTTSQDRMLIAITAFSRGREPRNGAWSIMQGVRARLRSTDGIQELRRHGISLRSRSAPTDISAVAGADWESRVSMDLEIVAQSVSIDPVELIESVRLSMTAAASTFEILAAAS